MLPPLCLAAAWAVWVVWTIRAFPSRFESGVKAAMELVPLDLVCRVIGWKVNKLCYPGNPILVSQRS